MSRAQTVTWTGGNGNWNVAADWTGGLAPNSGTNAVIDSGTTNLPLTVSGTAAMLMVGDFGTGTMNITGGSLTDGDGILALLAGSKGTATISSGTWSNTSSITVGYGGTGTLNMSGGSVSCPVSYIGYGGISSGTATISSGTWNTTGSAYVAYSGMGTLNINGGYVSDATASIGNNAGSNGTVTVSSGTWSNTGGIIVGLSGTGTLNINGGSVADSNAILGQAPGSNGTATISSGTWSNTSILLVGQSGTGTLNITGGSVTDSTGYLGWGSNGTATISSGTWNNISGLTVGNAGAGTLTVNNSGFVTVNSGSGTLTLASNAGSLGTLNLGTGGTAGTLNAAVVNGGAGSAAVNFNHTGSYIFAPQLTGNLSVNNLGAGTTFLTGSNSYAGATTISRGVLSVTTLANGGSSSNIGASSNAAANLVLNGGTLQYLGGVASTDRLFSVGTAGGAIDSSGSGPISFVNTGSMGFDGQAGARTLTLEGSTAGNELLAAIGDDGGSTSVVKQGSGTWTLGVNNTYSGGTTILGGSLDVLTGGNLGTGAVTNSGSLVINYSTATVISNNISGNGVFIQSGSGTTTLTGSNSYTGATMVTHGTLRVNGSISASSGVTISAGATLAGSGVVSNISGAGLVAPGDPQILTATQVDPTSNGSTSFNFQFSQLSPAYNNATSSGNDVLHLTGATPFKFTLASVNTITVDFSAITGTLALGQVYYGGFFLDHAATLGIPTFQYAGTGSYDVEYLGFATVGLAAFGTGTVTNGQVMEFMMVPEPCTWALLVAGAGLLATLRRRVKT